MSLFSRFFGKKDPESGLVANPQLTSSLSLQLLFDRPLALTTESVTEALRAYTPAMRMAQCELALQEKSLIGLLGWEKHVIRLVGFDAPMPAEAVEVCVAPAHYPQELKEQARAHTSHVLLYYVGYEANALEQYVALAAAAGALAACGALIVLNEAAHTSLPTGVLAEMKGGKALPLLKSLPLPILFCGFVKYEVEDIPGVWMRTYGANLLNLPDFAILAEGHHEGQKYFDLFSNIWSYLLSSKATFAEGHTMQIGPDSYFRVRLPTPEEYFLQSEGPLFVAELISAAQINRSGG